MSWVIGDVGFKGSATIWLARKRGDVWWNYAYTVKQTDYYCLATGGERCTETYHVR